MVNDGERMNKFIIDLPARVTILPYKQPCTVRVIKDGIEWVNDKKEEIKSNEIDVFLEDTKIFVNTLGVELIQSFQRGDRSVMLAQKAINTIVDYFRKWGAFVKSKDNKISIFNLCQSCFSVYISLNLWEQTNILGDLKHHINPDNHKGKPDEGKIIGWYAGSVDANRIWLPVTKATPYPRYSAYELRIRQPSKKEYDEKFLHTPEELIRYVKAEILRSVSNYMASQVDTRAYSMKFTQEGYFSFGLKIENRLLAYLIYSLPEFLKEEIRLCECGCGNLVSGRRKYIQGHYPQALAKREKKPDRALKAWVRRRKNLGHFTQEQCDFYYSIIDKEVHKGTADKDIRVKLESLMKEV